MSSHAFCDVCMRHHEHGDPACQDIGAELLAAVKAPLNPRFTLDTIMSALSEAFQRAGSRTSRDCRVEEYLREILSARPEHKEVFNESGGGKLLNAGKHKQQP